MARFDMDYVIHRRTDDRLFVLPLSFFMLVQALQSTESFSHEALCGEVLARSPGVDPDAVFSDLLQHGVISPLL